jgi:hypothetical protein
LVSMNPMVNASLPLLRTLKSTMEGLVVDQSEWTHLVSIPHLPGTPWLLPLSTSHNKPVPLLLTSNESNTVLAWMNIVKPSLFVSCAA